MEVSKFEAAMQHTENAIRLARKAVEVNPESYHTWFTLGISLRKLGMEDEAIDVLKKAKEINPKHLPIYNELGRAYTYKGLYENAYREFNEALKEEKYPNYRHKLITYQFLADNFRRWAEAFSIRHDPSGQIEMLQNGIESVKKALEINPKDKKVWELFWEIQKDYGMAIWRKEGYTKGMPILEACLGKMEFAGGSFIPDGDRIAKLCYYLANLSSKEKGITISQIEACIDKGIENCSDGSKYAERLKFLKQRINKGKEEKVEERKFNGTIKRIDARKKYGIIECSGRTYLFLIYMVRDINVLNNIGSLEGKSVSFVLINDPRGTNKYIASDVTLLRD